MIKPGTTETIGGGLRSALLATQPAYAQYPGALACRRSKERSNWPSTLPCTEPRSRPNGKRPVSCHSLLAWSCSATIRRRRSLRRRPVGDHRYSLTSPGTPPDGAR